MEVPQKKVRLELLCDTETPLLCIYLKEMKSVCQPDMRIPMFIALFFARAKIGDQLELFSIDE